MSLQNRNHEAVIEDDSVKYTKLIRETIELPELQHYFASQVANRQGIYVILENKYTKGLGIIEKYNQPVRMMDDEEIRKSGIKAYLEYKEVTIKNDTAKVYYQYDIQGVGIESYYKYTNGKWELICTNMWEN